MRRLNVLGCLVVAGMLMGARAQELPRPPEGGRVFPEWQALRDDAGVRKTLLPMAGTPQATWDAAGYVRLPVNFKGTRHARVNWDVRTKVDLRGSRGIQFDFYCRELEPFTSFSVYFRSGDGWYHASFCPDRAGVWQRIEIDKADTRVEGKPAGWGQVDAIRVSGWRGRDLDTLCAMANLGFAGGTPQVLVVRADSNVAGSGGEGKSFSRYAWTVSSTFDRLGIDSVQVADTDLAPDLFEGIKLVVLPYNPRIPATAVEHLRAYVAGGGKLLVCYSLPAEIGKLLGLRATGSVVAEPTYFMGFARTVQGLPAQPDFVKQASWRTTLAAPLEGQSARVLAVWRDGQGNDTPHPALTLTPAGAFMGHVWFGGGVEGLALMRAVAGEIVPDIWQKSAEQALARIGTIGGAADFAAFCAAVEAMRPSQEARDALAKSVAARDEAAKHLAAKRWHESLKASGEADDAARRAWFLTRKSRPGEHRAFWCHSAFGLPGKNWDESIRFLKEHGFTAIQPNMLWGGTAYYPSKVLPVYEGLAERGDQVEQCVAACRKYGVACHVWKVNWNMSNKAPSVCQAHGARGRVQKLFSGEVEIVGCVPRIRRIRILRSLQWWNWSACTRWTASILTTSATRTATPVFVMDAGPALRPSSVGVWRSGRRIRAGMRRSGRRGWRSGAPALIRWCGASLRRRVRSAPPCRSLRRCSATGRLTAITLVRIGACGASRDGWISSVPWTTSTRTLRSVIWSAHRKLSQARCVSIRASVFPAGRIRKMR